MYHQCIHLPIIHLEKSAGTEINNLIMVRLLLNLPLGSSKLGWVVKQETAPHLTPIPPPMAVGSADELLDFVYPGLNTLPEQALFQDQAILATQNNNVSRINHSVLERLNGKEITLFSVDTVVTELGANATAAHYPVKFL